LIFYIGDKLATANYLKHISGNFPWFVLNTVFR
jgi:hypothetical protein